MKKMKPDHWSFRSVTSTNNHRIRDRKIPKKNCHKNSSTSLNKQVNKLTWNRKINK